MPETVGDGGRLKAAMHHAVGAFFVIADTVGVPVGFLHQLAERLHVAFAEQITGPLPPENVPRRISPWRAVISLIAGQEIEKERRLVERPCFGAATARENTAEKPSGALTT